jgi:hypothetical protein
MRSGTQHRLCILLALAVSGGCATRPQVVPVEHNAYRVTVTGPSFASQAGTNDKALYAASSFCDKRGEQVLFRESQESGVHSWSPKREDLTFICGSASLRGDAAVASTSTR